VFTRARDARITSPVLAGEVVEIRSRSRARRPQVVEVNEVIEDPLLSELAACSRQLAAAPRS
jgi:hypothetical protein